MSKGQTINFKPAFYARIPVEAMTAAEMDTALEAGYYRNGNEFCSMSARWLGNNWVSSIMLRLPITGFSFKKRHRKLLTVNNLRFTYQFRPFQATVEMESLWQRFKSTVHKWNMIFPIAQHLLRGYPASAYNMWELCVFDGEKLVAFTAFDRGKTSIASLEAAYDPDYASHSLGFYTMLLEIAYCQNEGLESYYPGFLPKDTPMFNYKLRPGVMDYFDLKKKEWRPLSVVKTECWLLEELFDKLGSLKLLLIASDFIVMEGFGHCFHTPKPTPHIMDSNVHLIVLISRDKHIHQLFITWDVVGSFFQTYHGEVAVPEIPKLFKPIHFFYQVNQYQYLGAYQHPEQIVLLLRQFLSGEMLTKKELN